MTDQPRHCCPSRAVALGLLVFMALAGCEAPVGSEDEQVAAQSEALYKAGDFQLGIVGINYVNDKAFKSSESWTTSFGTIATSSSLWNFSGWTSSFSHPTGFRVGLKSLGAGFPLLQAADFRPVIALKNASGVTGSQQGNAFVSEPFTGPPYTFHLIDWSEPVSFGVAIEARAWPTASNVTDFRFAAEACNSTPGGILCGAREYTSYLSELSTGQVSWSHTVAPPGLTSQYAVRLWVEPR